MNALQQAQKMLEKAKYAEFFEIMLDLHPHSAELLQLRLEFMAGTSPILLEERMKVCLNALQNPQTSQPPNQQTPKPTHYLTPFYPSKTFIGRQDELTKLHTFLQKGLSTVIVNGIGGIGKTSLAREYITQNAHQYDHIVWLEQAGEAINAFTDNPHLQKAFQLSIQDKTEEQRLQDILFHLAGIQGTNLLVLDNYQRNAETASPYILSHFPFGTHWRVLFTSREEITDFTPLVLDTLPEEEAMSLFKMHAQGENIDDDELKSLLHDIGSHTLMIELLAKNYKANSGLKSIKDFAEKIQARQIDDAVLQRNVTTPYSKGETKLYTYLLKVFDHSALDAQSLHVLTQIAVLPAEPLPIELILATKHEEQETYREVLENLVRKGWLSFSGEESVQMHRLVQLVLLKVLLPTIQDCEILCNIIINILRSDEAQANPLAHQGFTPYAESLLQNIHFQDALDIKGMLQNELANFYYYVGDYTKAIRIAEQNKDFALQVFGKESQQYATVLNNLAGLYKSIGKYEEALLLYQECLQITEQVIGKQHLDYTQSLNNLAGLYEKIGNYQEALLLFQECLQITEQVLGKEHSQYATSLNNLAGLYESIGKYEEALPLYQECLQIREQVFGKQHPSYATILNNLAGLYISTGKYEEALPLYQECLQIREQVLGKQHPNYATTLYNMGNLLIQIQQIEEGIQHIFTAYKILQENVGDEHPYTKRVKEVVDAILQNMKGG